MELARAVQRRRMVRRYTDEPVAPAVLERVVRTALQGPSAGFSQGVRMVVVTDAQRRRRVAQLCGEEDYAQAGFERWLSVAPVHVLLGVREQDYRERYAQADKAAAGGPDAWSAPYWWVDAGAALMLLLLAAVDEGLGAGVLDVGAATGLRDLLRLPDDVAPVCLVTIGHPADDPGPPGSAARGRRNTDDAVHWEQWTD